MLIFGKSYAPQPIINEYIVFSEFQILEGKSDFTIFTDRSRMKIILIEIKGADFNFLNSNGTINQNIHHAAQQVRDRLNDINEHYQFFRGKFHDIRRRVEGGESVYNSLRGTSSRLEVDPLKDICIKGCVIGGRTGSNDIEASIVRNRLGKEAPNILYDSWDSWLRKNQRVIY